MDMNALDCIDATMGVELMVPPLADIRLQLDRSSISRELGNTPPSRLRTQSSIHLPFARLNIRQNSKSYRLSKPRTTAFIPTYIKCAAHGITYPRTSTPCRKRRCLRCSSRLYAAPVVGEHSSPSC